MVERNHTITQQIGDAEAEVERLEAEVGDAVLDGNGSEQVEALRQAREQVEALRLAAGAAQKRKAERTEAEQADADRAERARYYQSVVDWLLLVAAVMEKRRELADAERDLLLSPPDRLVRKLQLAPPRPSNCVGYGLDRRLAHKLPVPPSAGRAVEDVAPARVAELIARAKELAKSERTGEPPKVPRSEWG